MITPSLLTPIPTVDSDVPPTPAVTLLSSWPVSWRMRLSPASAPAPVRLPPAPTVPCELTLEMPVSARLAASTSDCTAFAIDELSVSTFTVTSLTLPVTLSVTPGRTPSIVFAADGDVVAGCRVTDVQDGVLGRGDVAERQAA